VEVIDGRVPAVLDSRGRKMAVTLNVLPPCCMIPLRALTQVAPDALITGATYFFPFFVGKYGPSVAPMETEVLVRVSANLDDLRARLEEAQPEVRWKVRTAGATPCPDGDKGIEDALQDAPIVALCGGVRLENGVPTYHFGHQDALRHLRDGLLVPNSGDISGSRELAADLLSQFPGLRADFISYSGKTLHETYEDIHQAVQQNEYGGRMKKSSFLPVEQKWIEAIRQWHRMSTAPRVFADGRSMECGGFRVSGVADQSSISSHAPASPRSLLASHA